MKDTARLNKIRTDLVKKRYELRTIEISLRAIVDKEGPATGKALNAANTLEGIVYRLDEALTQVTEAFDASHAADTETAL